MDIILHSCDIGNPFKPWEIYNEWAFRVLEEFWNQVFFLEISVNSPFFQFFRVIKKEIWGYQYLIFVIDILQIKQNLRLDSLTLLWSQLLI